MWDGITLACDSRVCADSYIVTDDFIKIYDLRLIDVNHKGDKLLALACAGIIAQYDPIIDLIIADSLSDLPSDHEVTAIVVGERSVYFLELGSDQLVQYNRNTFLTGGSGGLIALTALHMKKTARQAIKIAARLDSATGGTIRSLRLGDQ